MSATRRVFAAQLRHVVRSRWVVSYTILLLAMSILLLRFGGTGERALASLGNVVLLLAPLVSVVFGCLYFYHTREFTELLLAQPIRRGVVYWTLFAALAAPAIGALVVGVGIPLGVQAVSEPRIVRPLLVLLGVGAGLTLTFTALALAVATRVEDRTRGFATVLMVWLACTVAYDALVLLVITTLRAYPMQGPVLILSSLNPIDVARLALLATMDASILLGFTGALFQRALGSAAVPAAFGVLLITALVPVLLGRYWFARKDF
jgi:Cu-processing system permease protein